MVAWWWLLVVFVLGFFLGIMLMCLLIMARGVFDDDRIEQAIETVEFLQERGYGVEVYFNPKRQWQAQGKLYVKVYGPADVIFGSTSKRGYWQNDFAHAVAVVNGKIMRNEGQKWNLES